MNTRRMFLGGIAAGVLLIVAAGAGLAYAGDEEGGGATFLDRVASKLGIERDELEQAVRDARSDEIDEAVESGELTEKQAERLKERLDEAPLDRGWGPPHHRFDIPGRPHAGVFGGAFAGGGEALAEFLGISEEELREELRAEGASLASVAEAHAKTRDELKAFLLEEAETRLDDAVADGIIPQEHADEMKETLSQHLDALIDRDLPGFKWHFKFPAGGPFGDDGDEREAPTEESEPESSFRS